MPRFTYVSRNADGHRVTAVMEAPSRQQALEQLKTQGLTAAQVDELPAYGTAPRAAARRMPGWRLRLGVQGGVSTAELSIFWREFATMIAAGLPVIEALQAIAEEVEHRRLRAVLTDIVASLWEGLNLSQSLARHRGVFSTMVVALIGAAEESGSLAEISAQLAGYLERRDQLFRKVRAALTYPIFLCGFFLVVMAIATFWLLPWFRDIYSGFNAKLPRLTETVFGVNAFVLHNLPWLLVGSAAGVLALVLWGRRPTGRFVLDRLSLAVPVFGPLLQRAAVARFCRSFAILLAGGIPVNRALELAEETAGNRVVAKAVADSREEILQGSKIAASLKRRKFFPNMAIRMVSAGEETGSLSSLLEKVAEFYESRVDAMLLTINSLIEPILIIAIGMFVLVFVLAMYLPVFSLGAALRG